MNAPAEDWVRRAKLKRAVDGDTLWVVVDVGYGASMTVELRLEDIDAPEIVGVNKAAGLAARDALAAQIGDQWMTVQTFKNSNDVDVRSFTRWIARVWLEDGTYLNEWMVAQGHATPATY